MKNFLTVALIIASFFSTANAVEIKMHSCSSKLITFTMRGTNTETLEVDKVKVIVDKTEVNYPQKKVLGLTNDTPTSFKHNMNNPKTYTISYDNIIAEGTCK
ncbi:MAG: hypothetical protein GY828_00025 [Candidatus Gracilibacteria bacterium]|nr:hypothetical protein [Candidatus Gracilibacteria bacterium]